MFTKHLMGAFLVTLAASLNGCAAETSEEVAQDESDAFALTDDSSDRGGGNVEIARAEASRACTSSEAGAAQQHADANHTVTQWPWAPIRPTLTSCTVSNGYIVYTYLT